MRSPSLAGLLIVLAVALAARVQPWTEVFVPGRPGATFLGDTDPYYHALRAERILAEYPRVPWHDGWMNFPFGSDILWPPLFDHLIATGAFITGGGHPTRAVIERVAAMLPPLLGVATVGVVAALGSVLFGGGPWLGAALLLALLPAHVEFTVVGRADQHAAELLLQTLVMLVFAAAWRIGGRGARAWGWPLALGLAIALSFWNWQGSALYLILLAAFTGIWHVIDAEGDIGRRIDSALASGAGVGTAMLIASLLVWGRPGAALDLSLTGITGIQALLTALVALFALGLGLAIRLRRGEPPIGRRILEVALAALAPIGVAWVFLPGLRIGLGQGLLALTAGNPWYASIREFQPLLFGGAGIVYELWAWVPRFALLFVMPFAALALARVWHDQPEHRPSLMLLLVWGLLLLLLALARKRFTLYLSVPAALWAWIALQEMAGHLSRRFAWRWTQPATLVAAIGVVLAPAVFYFSHGGIRRDPTQMEVINALEWLRGSPAPYADRIAVFSEWNWGHLVQYFGSRPSVATPFGSDGGVGAVEDTAAFFLSTSPDDANRILEKRRAGYLMMVDPLTQAAESLGLAPTGGSPPVVTEWHWLWGPRMVASPVVDDLVAVRIYYDNGLSARGLPSLDRYRLVYEGSPLVPRQVRLFEFVPGAGLFVQSASPNSLVRVAVTLRTNRDRVSTWYTASLADGEGRARLQVPYSTGANGAVHAGPYLVTNEGRGATVAVPPLAVEQGEAVPVVLRPQP